MSLRSLAIAFVAGFISVVVFHQAGAALLNVAGIATAGTPPWSLDPIPPFGVPSIISKAFWGGLWAMLLWAIMAGRAGASYWLGWIILGATALPLVAIFVVPVVKGGAPADFWTRYPVSATLNGLWGLGTAILLRFLGRG